MTQITGDIAIGTPQSEDGAALHELVAACPPLDGNSMYCNLLQCSHFARTCAAAKIDDKLVGFISAYLIPDRPDTLFVWQVAVGEMARGQGLATRMLKHILNRPVCSHVTHLETTVTKSNQPSWALFNGLARSLDCPLEKSVFFDQQQHFNGQHDSELLARIGPFKTSEL